MCFPNVLLLYHLSSYVKLNNIMVSSYKKTLVKKKNSNISYRIVLANILEEKNNIKKST